MKNIDVRDLVKIYFSNDENGKAVVIYEKKKGDGYIYKVTKVSKDEGKQLLSKYAKKYNYANVEELKNDVLNEKY